MKTARFTALKLTAFCLVSHVSACASAPAPTERLVAAESSLRAAEEVGAEHYPQAQYHAQLAREQLEQARKLVADGDNERADMVLRRATADAEVAVAISREGAAKQAASAPAGANNTPNP